MIRRAVLLAAGRGSRLAPLTDDRPKCLVELDGVPLLLRQLDALAAAGIDEVVAVGGYRHESLAPHVDRLLVNERWDETNMVGSLLLADEVLRSGPVLVAYTDLVYTAATVAPLLGTSEPLVVAYDPDWQSLWEARMEDPLDDAETFRLGDGGRLVEIGARPRSLDEIEGQYLGLIAVRPAGWQQLRSVLDGLDDRSVDRLDLTGLLGRALAAGHHIGTSAIGDRWGEVDTADDLALYASDPRFAGLRGPVAVG